MQRGLAKRVRVEEVPGKGYGLRSLEGIATNTYICEYIGEVYSSLASKLSPQDLDYTLKFSEGDMPPFYLVSSRFGNVSRFINHSD